MVLITIVAWCLLPVTQAEASTRPLRMIVLGDSYSAGVGLGPVSRGCDRNDGNYGSRAYREILAPHRPAGKLMVAACSGATTASLRAQQLSQVNSTFNVAVMTIGGNDVDVGGKVEHCIKRAGVCGDASHLANLNPYPLPSWDAYVQGLADLYVDVLGRLGPDGHLYILSYPTPFAGQQRALCEGMIPSTQAAANAYSTRLGDRTIDAVNQARALQRNRGKNANIHYVGWRTGNVYAWTTPSGERVRAHWNNSEGLCNTQGKTPLLNGLGPFFAGQKNNSLHPNSTGYWFAARLLAQSIDRHQP